MYIYIYIYICIYIYTYIYIYMCVCVCIFLCLQLYLYFHIHLLHCISIYIKIDSSLYKNTVKKQLHETIHNNFYLDNFTSKIANVSLGIVFLYESINIHINTHTTSSLG